MQLPTSHLAISGADPDGVLAVLSLECKPRGQARLCGEGAFVLPNVKLPVQHESARRVNAQPAGKQMHQSKAAAAVNGQPKRTLGQLIGRQAAHHSHISLHASKQQEPLQGLELTFSKLIGREGAHSHVVQQHRGQAVAQGQGISNGQVCTKGGTGGRLRCNRNQGMLPAWPQRRAALVSANMTALKPNRLKH
jgi:hypothetical protein